MGVLAGLGLKFMGPELRELDVSPISLPNSFKIPGPP